MVIRVYGAKQHVYFYSPVLLTITVLVSAFLAPGIAQEIRSEQRTLQGSGMSSAPLVAQPSGGFRFDKTLVSDTFRIVDTAATFSTTQANNTGTFALVPSATAFTQVTACP